MRKTGFAVALVLAFVSGAAAEDRMPAAQQNALVEKYCAVCHTDAARNGGLTLEHFDAATADPGVAAMMVSKLRGGALGAAGGVLPDRATQNALEAALVAEAEGANKWTFENTGAVLTAGIVQASPPAQNLTEGKPDLYRLTVTCGEDRHRADVQLAWSPGVPEQGWKLDVSVDGGRPVAYKVEGEEMDGNGMGRSGPGAISLFGAGAAKLAALPERSLTVGFAGGSLSFPFGQLDANARQALSSCMVPQSAAR